MSHVTGSVVPQTPAFTIASGSGTTSVHFSPPPSYVGEIGAFATFATAWLTASWDLWAVALGVPTFLSWIQRSGRLAWRKVVGA